MVSQIKNRSVSPEDLQNETNTIIDFTSQIKDYSVSPEGEEFPIPELDEYKKELRFCQN